MEIINISLIPDSILTEINKLISKLSNIASIYSIDVTTDKDRLYLVELNSSPGIAFNKKDKETENTFFNDIIELLKEY